jgi:hypothetical protein
MQMKQKIIFIVLLVITLLVFVGCVSYTEPVQEVDIVDSDLADVDSELVEESIGETDESDESDESDILDEIEDSESDAVGTAESTDEEPTESDTAESDTVDQEIELELEEQDESDSAPIKNENQITITIDENELVNLNAIVTDPDEDEVTYFFSEPLSQRGSWQTNYGDAGEYDVTLTATDGVNTVEQMVLLVVNRVNVEPIISSLKDLFYSEGDEIIFEPSVEDPNGDEVTVSISAPLKDGRFDTDHTSAGEYEITVVASDGELESEKTFTLSIEDVNVLPVISGIKDLEVAEGDTVQLDLTVEDLDGDEVNISISDPVGDDGVWEVSFTDNGEYQITITVDDGKDIVKETFTILVSDVNMPPQIIDVTLNKE